MTGKTHEYIIGIGYETFLVEGTTVAWNAYEKAINFAELIGEEVTLIDSETGELLASSWDEE